MLTLHGPMQQRFLHDLDVGGGVIVVFPFPLESKLGSLWPPTVFHLLSPVANPETTQVHCTRFITRDNLSLKIYSSFSQSSSLLNA